VERVAAVQATGRRVGRKNGFHLSPHYSDPRAIRGAIGPDPRLAAVPCATARSAV
jgi:hypothetical protein